MRCPFCQTEDTRVIETRANDEQGTIRRRRECQDCRRRFTTYERREEPQLFVIKKDGRREAFDREKLLDGVTKACQKRPVSREIIESLVYEIEHALRDALRDEVTTTLIGDMVMSRLRQVDEVAYVRFASVYKEFRDLESFLDEISHVFEWTKQERLAQEQHNLFETGEPAAVSTR